MDTDIWFHNILTYFITLKDKLLTILFNQKIKKNMSERPLSPSLSPKMLFRMFMPPWCSFAQFYSRYQEHFWSESWGFSQVEVYIHCGSVFPSLMHLILIWWLSSNDSLPPCTHMAPHYHFHTYRALCARNCFWAFYIY